MNDKGSEENNTRSSDRRRSKDTNNLKDIKRIEVTARDIVSRISDKSVQCVSEQDKGKTLGSTASGPSGSELDSDRNSIFSSNSTCSGQNSPNNCDVESLKHKRHSAEQKAIEQLLEAVQKWVLESKHSGGVDALSLCGNESFNAEFDNLHWIFSIESYLRSIDSDWSEQKNLTGKIAKQLLQWIKQLFHFRESPKDFDDVHPHWDANAGMTSMTQLSMHIKFPLLKMHGYQHFQDSKHFPIFYCSDDYVGRHICSKIGLPYSSMSVIDFLDDQWVNIFEQKVLSDQKEGLSPIILLVNTAVENLEQGVKVAESHGIWVHLYGTNVLAYFLRRPESSQLGHSFTIDLTKWLKSPKLPYLTVYKKPSETDETVLDLCELNSPRNEIMCFTPWFITHMIGKMNLSNLVNEAIHRGNFLLQLINRYECLKIVPNCSKLSDGTKIMSTITFQYNPKSNKLNGIEKVRKEETEEEIPSKAYIQTINSWLFQIIDRDFQSLIQVEYVFVESTGWNIHIDVIRCKNLTDEEEKQVATTFDNHMAVLEATVKHRMTFQALVREREELECVNLDSQWAGLGSVRYIPTVYRDRFSRELKGSVEPSKAGSPQQKSPERKNSTASNCSNPPVAGMPKTVDKRTMNEHINRMNARILNKLKEIDTAFSLGEEESTGLWCIQFGMVTDQTDVSELLKLVASCGREIEETFEFFNKMSELVRKGIQTATEELKKESEEALWEEGILRRVPVVGTFYNWFSPPAKEAGVKGRALNLAEGKVESTENIYKYHMQVLNHGGLNGPSNLNPPKSGRLSSVSSNAGSLASTASDHENAGNRNN